MCIATPINVPNARRGFTLVELMVVLVIIGLLASLTLAGLAGVRQRAKEAKTKSTIRKVHEIIMPQYESYLRRRVPFTRDPTNPIATASNRLVALRRLMVREMPDSWGDVYDSVSDLPAPATADAYLATGPVRMYATMKTLQRIATNGNAECLYMCVAFGGSEPDVLEQFRSDEIGDRDGDGAPEFLDAWNEPIIFLRWAPGFTGQSPIQLATIRDPFDPESADPNGYALVPLIASGGSDKTIALWFELAGGWQQWESSPGLQTIVTLSNPLLGSIAGAAEARDNITNHDFLKK
jgi:prepilin-type N-terminal cleavage/methylation domain-containing protein